MSFWAEVNDLVGKGKTDKPVKVTAQELVDIRSKMEDLQQQVAVLEKTTSNDKEKMVKLNTELDTAKKQLDDIVAENAKMMNDLETEKNDLTNKIKQLEQEIQSKNEQMQQAVTQLNQFQEGIQQLQIQNEQLNQQLASGGSQVGDLNKKLQIEQQRASQAENNLRQVQMQLQQAEMKFQQADAQYKQLQTQSSGLVSNDIVAQKDAMIQQLNNQIQSLNNQVLQLQSGQIAQGDLDAMKKSTESLQTENAMMSQQLAAANQEIAKLQSIIIEKDKKIKDLDQPHAVMGSAGPAPRGQPMPQAPAQPMGGGMDAGPGGKGDRKQCPNCGSTHVREVEDKTKIISYVPRVMYGKKMVCIKCSYEF